MATTTLQKGLLGYDPMELRAQEQKVWSNLYGQAGSPYEKIGLGLAQIGGKLFGGETEAQSRENIVNKALQTAAAGATPGTPEYWTIVAQSLPANMADSIAYATAQATTLTDAAQKAQMERVKFVTENPQQLNTAIAAPAATVQGLINRAVQANGGQPLNEQQVAALQSSSAYQNLIGLNAAQEAGVTKAEGAPTTAADKVIYQNFIKQTGDPLKAALLFQDYKANLTQKGNTPLTAGNIKTGDIATFVTNVETNLKPAQTKLIKYNELRGLIDLAARGNADAVPQLERWLVTAAGDNQIGAAETKRIAAAGGIAERTVGGVQSFIVGTPTADKLKKLTQVVDTLEGQAGKQYNDTRTKLFKTWETSQLPSETLNAQLGNPYVSAADKKKAMQDKAAEDTRQSGFQVTPAQNSLLNKYLQKPTR
jgi:hypothetical protein